MLGRKADAQVDPRPVALVASHLEGLLTAYSTARTKGTPQLDALLAAVNKVFRGSARREVLAYLSGRSDDALGEGAGQRITADLVQLFEHDYRESLGFTY